MSAWTASLVAAAPRADEVWCVFGNTARGAAQANALSMVETMRGASRAA